MNYFTYAQQPAKDLHEVSPYSLPEGFAVFLVEPRTVARLGVQRMLDHALPGVDVAAVGDIGEISPEQLGAPAIVLLSTEALMSTSEPLKELFNHARSRLILLVGRGLNREQLLATAKLPVNAVLREDDLSSATLVNTLSAVNHGIVTVSPEMIRELLALAAEITESTGSGRPTLSARELDALRLMAQGCTNRQIANGMHISEHGAKRHVANILAKLGCQNRTMAVTLAMRMGMVEIDHGDDDSAGSSADY